jgi:hypothetical protein
MRTILGELPQYGPHKNIIGCLDQPSVGEYILLGGDVEIEAAMPGAECLGDFPGDVIHIIRPIRLSIDGIDHIALPEIGLANQMQPGDRERHKDLVILIEE